MREIGSFDQFSVIASLGSDELPEDLREYSKKASQRKVSRLLDRVFYAPYVAAVELHKQHGFGELDRIALYTVSGWDPSIPVPDYAFEDAPDRVEKLSHFYTHPANPTDWLRRMPNNPICNIAITTLFRGPCMHYIGDAESLSMLTSIAISTVADGSADAAIVVAFDLPEGEQHLLAHEGDSSAAAVLIGPGGQGPSAGGLVEAGKPGTSALAAMQEFIVGTRAGAR
ncbi:hypothetical protein SAMN05421504_108198 [Amycolatopsis xylanica]|uniref:Beta-ketoacyl synthase, N-terminal domain n=1 Tax=Amycolatopsis xylanica TaxID=589385 RepID=A0A1H3PG21_9PSEU|nr:hypothetical protein [Amycolatopsis xylanica]SDZ00030.1 hypothetical protein SAMN05421504_108198 [Amycolatopsis xylanica]